jgi:hypothetical protein
MNTKITAVYGCAVLRPQLATFTVNETTWMERLQGKLFEFWYNIKSAGMFAISVMCFKYALLGHF